MACKNVNQEIIYKFKKIKIEYNFCIFQYSFFNSSQSCFRRFNGIYDGCNDEGVPHAMLRHILRIHIFKRTCSK